jgi:hypothetical protein
MYPTIVAVHQQNRLFHPVQPSATTTVAKEKTKLVS